MADSNGPRCDPLPTRNDRIGGNKNSASVKPAAHCDDSERDSSDSSDLRESREEKNGEHERTMHDRIYCSAVVTPTVLRVAENTKRRAFSATGNFRDAAESAV